MPSFQQEIERFNKKFNVSADVEFRKFALEIANRAVSNTPVDSGRLRANWQIDINTQPTSSVLADTSGPTKSARAARASEIAKRDLAATANRIKITDDIFISNNLTYALPVEQGTEKRRPSRMLARAIADVRRGL